MNVGKAIYYLLSNAQSVTDIAGTRIYPELAEQEAVAPYAVYQIVSVNPDDTNDGPAVIDEVVVDILCVAESYNEAADLATAVRASLDRVRGTYNGVNVESIQYDSTDSDVQDSPRRYEQTVTLTVRVFRDAAQIATGQNIDQLTLGRLYDVTITDPLERDALVYDPETAEWINGIPTDIPVINSTGNTHYAGSPLRAVGVQGDKVQAALWTPNQDPKLFIGLASADIAPGATGYCRQIGIVHHLDTSTFEIGDILYPLASTLQIGIKRLGTTPPDHPLARVACAIVLRKHENTGRVFVRTWQPAHAFNDISEVNIATTPGDGQALTFDSATGTWSPGNTVPRGAYDLADVFDYSVGTLSGGSVLVWDAINGYWFPQPKISFLPGASAYYLGQYDIEAGNGRIAASTASVTVERYLTIQGDGEGESISAQSDTPSSGNKIVRKIWYKANSFEQSDVDTWTLVHTFADDTAYSATEATFEALLNAQTYGTPPFTLAQSWEEAAAFTGLLDTYPGAAAAYSLRLLDADYSGSAINVRRASDNAVQDIGFDANGDLDTSALATFCAGTDGFVVRWYDQSGNANDAVQATTSAQPKIYDAATGVELENSVEALTFTGTQVLQMVSNLGYTGTNPRTTFLVVKKSASGNPYRVFDSLIGGAGERYRHTTDWGIEVNNGFRVWSDASFVQRLLTLTFPTGATAVEEHTMHINGSLATPGGTNTEPMNTLDAQYLIGSGYIGTIQALIFYPSDQSANRTGIESNINDYYTIY